VVEHLRVADAVPHIDPQLTRALLVDLPVPAERLVGRLPPPVVSGRGPRLLRAERRRWWDRRSGRADAAPCAVDLRRSRRRRSACRAAAVIGPPPAPSGALPDRGEIAATRAVAAPPRPSGHRGPPIA